MTMRKVTGLVLLMLMHGLLAACAGPGASSPGAPASAAASLPALPADFPTGSWVMTVTEQDLRDGGVSDPALLRENAGTYTRTYTADGTWTVAAETPVPVRWPVFRGTYTVEAGQIVEVTTFPTDYAGDVVHYAWSRQGDALVLDVLDPPDPVLPILTEAHPWQPK